MLFANLNCVACHISPIRKGDGADGADAGRLSLAHVRAKFKPAALEQYLYRPSHHFAWNPMPDFHLTTGEAESLAAFLLSIEATPMPAVAPGDPIRGEKLFHSAGCARCHEPEQTGFPGKSRLDFRQWSKLKKGGWSSGCLAVDPAKRKAAPDFGLSAEQRDGDFVGGAAVAVAIFPRGICRAADCFPPLRRLPCSRRARVVARHRLGCRKPAIARGLP